MDTHELALPCHQTRLVDGRGVSPPARLYAAWHSKHTGLHEDQPA